MDSFGFMEKKEKLSQKQTEQLIALGRKLKHVRIKNGHTSYENFAYDNGLNRANYGKYEKGKNMTVATLIKT